MDTNTAQPLSTDNLVAKSVLEDDLGKRSMMRLMSIISLFAAIGFGVLTLYLGTLNIEVASPGLCIFTGFLIGAFAPKALQKYIESNYPALPSLKNSSAQNATATQSTK